MTLITNTSWLSKFIYYILSNNVWGKYDIYMYLQSPYLIVKQKYCKYQAVDIGGQSWQTGYHGWRSYDEQCKENVVTVVAQMKAKEVQYYINEDTGFTMLKVSNKT